MSFWEDASPLVKGALVIGVLGLLYFAVAFFAGLPPFPGSCKYEDDAGQQISGCPEGSACIDGECKQERRGLAR